MLKIKCFCGKGVGTFEELENHTISAHSIEKEKLDKPAIKTEEKKHNPNGFHTPSSSSLQQDEATEDSQGIKSESVLAENKKTVFPFLPSADPLSLVSIKLEADEEDRGLSGGFNSISFPLEKRDGNMEHTCDKCGKVLNKSSNLKMHMQTHLNARPFECNKCAKKFSQMAHLQKHQVVHTGDKLFPCNECGKRFSSSSNLKTHKRWHTGETPYTCDKCPKKFRQLTHLKNHQTVHTGEKPFPCTECSKRFTSSSNLKTHSRLHTTEMPFKCQICPTRFNQKRQLQLHQFYLVCEEGNIES